MHYKVQVPFRTTSVHVSLPCLHLLLQRGMFLDSEKYPSKCIEFRIAYVIPSSRDDIVDFVSMSTIELPLNVLANHHQRQKQPKRSNSVSWNLIRSSKRLKRPLRSSAFVRLDVFAYNYFHTLWPLDSWTQSRVCKKLVAIPSLHHPHVGTLVTFRLSIHPNNASFGFG